MADQPTGTTPTAPAAAAAPSASSKKKPGTQYELTTNESGILRRVAVQPAAAAPAAPAAPASPPAATVEDDETLVFGEEGELTGEEREAALQQTKEKELAAELKKKLTKEAEAAKRRKPAKQEGKLFESETEQEKLKLFYDFRSKNPKAFTYTPEGNLSYELLYKKGVIPLRAFSPLRPEELETIEQAQKEKIQTIEKTYVEKMKNLQSAYQRYKDNPTDTSLAYTVLLKNTELREVSIARNAAMYPERWIHKEENPEIRSILLHQPYEQRHMGYDVFCFKRFGLSRQDAEGHYRQHGEVAPGGQTGGATVVLFITTVDDPQTGLYHPIAEREFVYNETKYASPYQAYETERFKQMENEEMVEKLLGTRSAKTIKQLVSNEPVRLEQSEKLWEEILEAFYTQFKDAADTLKETGSARFHVMDKQFGSPEYANALATVRTKLKERENDAPGDIEEVKQSVITKAQQEKDKVGAIINNFRRRP